MYIHFGQFRVIFCLSLLNMSTVRWFCTNTYFKSRITVKVGRTDQAKLHVMRQDWLGATANGLLETITSKDDSKTSELLGMKLLHGM